MADEATAVNETVEAPTTTESAPEETKELEVVREGEPVEPQLYEQKETEGEESAEESQEESKEEVAEETEDEKPLGEKGQKRLQKLANEKKQLEEYIKQLEAVKPPQPEPFDVQRAMDEGMTQEEARLAAIESKLELSEVTAKQQAEQQRLTELNTALLTDAENVVRDFPEFDERSDKYDPELTNRIVDMWHQAADVQYMTDSNGQVITDTNGQPIVQNARLSLYDFVENINAIGNAKQSKGAVEGQKAAEKNLSAVEVRPSTKPKQTNSDDSKLSSEAYAKKYGLSVHR